MPLRTRTAWNPERVRWDHPGIPQPQRPFRRLEGPGWRRVDQSSGIPEGTLLDKRGLDVGMASGWQEVNRTVNGTLAPTNPLNPGHRPGRTTDGAEDSDPLLADTDGDGFLDGQELFHGTNPASMGTSDLSPVVLVDLNASGLTPGALAAWSNSGLMGGQFTAGTPVAWWNGLRVRGVTLDGSGYYDGPTTPCL